MMTRQELLRAALLSGIATVMGASVAHAQARYPETLKVGAVLNLTGPTAAQGAEFRRGLELAAKQWNDKGGIGGSKIEWIFEDHGAQPAKAVTGAQKLIQVDGVKVLANVYSSPVLAVVPIAERAQVLQISAGATSPRLVNVSKYFMTSVANASLEAEVILAFAKKKLGLSKISILYGNDDFGTGMRDSVVKLWGAGGGTVIASEGVDPAKPEMVAVSAKLAAGKPDAVYMALAGSNIGAAVKQLREAGLTQTILSHQGYEAPELFAVAGAASANSYWTSATVAAAKDKEDAFVAAFKATFNSEPTVFARTHFDLGMSFFEAAAKVRAEGKEWTAENFRAGLLGLGQTVGVLGAFSYRDDGTALRALDIKTIADGKAAIHLTSAQIQSEGIFSYK
jgi:branched-chain amino acid transport system substrate-binding protein